MLTAVAPTRARTALRTRVGLLLGLLLVEGGLLAARFNAQPLTERNDAWWALVIGESGFVMPVLLATITALVLLGGARLWNELEVAAADSPPPHAWPFLLGHALAFVVFFRLTALVFEEDGGGAWAAAWVVTGGAALAAVGAAALPARAFWRFARRAVPMLIGGTVIGALAVAAGQMTVQWWHPLGRSTMWLVYQLIRPFTVDDPRYFPEYAVIGTQTFEIMIGPKCSGYQGIGLVSVFLAVYLVAFRRTLRFPHALLLLPIGAVAMFVVNAMRIAALIGVGTLISEDVAIGGFHANSGSLLLCVVALGLGWLGHVHPFFTTEPVRPTVHLADGPAATHLAPLVVIAVTAMLTGAASRGGFDPLYGLRVVAAGVVLWSVRRAYGDWRLAVSWPAIGIGVVVFVLWLALEPAPAGGAGSALAEGLAALSPEARTLWLALRVAGAVVTVPIAEELAFRGYLAPRLTARDPSTLAPGRLSWIAIAASSLLFGAMHDRVLAGTLAGVLYALAFVRRGALGDAILAHATTNALLAAYVLATGSWFLW